MQHFSPGKKGDITMKIKFLGIVTAVLTFVTLLAGCGGGGGGGGAVVINPTKWTGTKQLGVSGQYTSAFGVAVDSSRNVYVAGYTYGGLDGNTLMGTSDFFVTMYDPAGNKVRTKQLDVAGKYTNAYGVAVDSSDNAVYVAGYTDGGLDGNTLTGIEDFFLTMYDSAGIKQ
jgi:hypothetical protein